MYYLIREISIGRKLSLLLPRRHRRPDHPVTLAIGQGAIVATMPPMNP